MSRVIRRPWERLRVAFECVGESMVDKSHKQAVDINVIVKRFHRTGHLAPAMAPSTFADVTRLQGDLGERMRFASETIAEAERFLSSRAAPPAGAAAPVSGSVSSSPGSG